MSELSKVFYIDPKTLPLPIPDCYNHKTNEDVYKTFPPRGRCGWRWRKARRLCHVYNDLKKDILTNGFDSKRSIIVRESTIVDGNHRLDIALELKLNLVPVRFLHAN
jgi:hypothetical protein